MLLFIFDGVVDVITAVAVVEVVDYLGESDKNPIFSAESVLQNERRQQAGRQAAKQQQNKTNLKYSSKKEIKSE